MTEKKKTNDALDALQRIREAEEKARKIVQDARETKAAKIIQDADDEAKKIKERHLNQARQKAEQRKSAIVQRAAKEAGEIRKKPRKRWFL